MNRYKCLQQFLNRHFNNEKYQLSLITGDASFRRYYRLSYGAKSYIVMDSDPKVVDNTPYVELNHVFSKCGFLLPTILNLDEQQGFFLLNDLGSTHLADLLQDTERKAYYQQLISLSSRWANVPATQHMKDFDAEFIQFELNIFIEWLVEGVLQQPLNDKIRVLWQSSCVVLVDNILTQPKVTVHRDFHSRNIMRSDNQWAVIDYQDAVTGPVCYDLVSLLRDCYFKLPEKELNSLLNYAFTEFSKQGLIKVIDYAQFIRWFDLTGVQRHLKAAGIFCRLNLRDGKSGYIKNILPTLCYIVEIAKKYNELNELGHWVEHEIIPAITKAISEKVGH
jgi:hypothetical protein